MASRRGLEASNRSTSCTVRGMARILTPAGGTGGRAWWRGTASVLAPSAYRRS